MKEKNSAQKSILYKDNIEQIEQARSSGILDYRSEALPIWCPGCGYFGITHAVNRTLKDLAIPPRNLVVVSGIGCSGRYPFFTKCYGLHAVHGRVLPVAGGVKMANSELTVIAIGGDGDGLAIGGGHLPHAIRRNIDITYILFDNGIYGLTKGQSSPTTPMGQVTKTHPRGNPDVPINPTLIALSYGATYVAKGYAADPQTLSNIISQAIEHRGFSFVHIISPCVTFDHENLTYQRLQQLWFPLPENHDQSDLRSAMDFAIKEPFFAGIYLKVNRPCWEDLNRS